jgi:hypothetical protein
MVLETDVPEARVGLVGNVKLVRRAIGPAVGLGPFVEVHASDSFPVQLDGNLGAVAGDHHVIPIADGLHGVFGRFHQVVNRPGINETGRLGVVDGDLDSVESDVLPRPRLERMSADENSAIAAFADLEIQCQHEVGPGLLVDHHVTSAAVRIDAPVFNGNLAGLL